MISKNTETFINLVRAGLSGKTESLSNDFNLEMFLSLAKKHSIMNLLYHGACLCQIDESSDTMQRLYVGAVAELAFHERQAKELEALFCEFEKNEICYMPLKGSVLKTLYRKPELRSMGDADILIRMEEYPKIKEVMESFGFEYKYESNNEIVWKKGNGLHIELHRALFPSYSEEYLVLFDNCWSKAVKDGSGYRYRMSFEDEFVYNFTHFVKHYKLGGIGVKHLCDLWVLLQNRELDFAEIDRKIETLNLTEFYQNIRKTLSFWFSDGEADSKVEIITKTVIKSGAFGTKKSSQNAFALRLASENQAFKGKNKLAVWMFKSFPSVKFIEHQYPFLKKHRWLLPVAWVLRWFDAIFINRRKIKNGLRAIKNTDSEKSLQIEKDFLAVGLRYKNTEE